MKGVLKVSKEQVIEIERYCDEHGITRKQRIDELGLSHTAYYYTRGLLSEEELHGGQFIPIMSGSGLMQTASMPVGRSRRKQASVQTELMTIEVGTSSGAEMRLTGNFSEVNRTLPRDFPVRGQRPSNCVNLELRSILPPTILNAYMSRQRTTRGSTSPGRVKRPSLDGLASRTPD